MITSIELRDGVDLTELIQWVIDNCVSFVEYQVIETPWSIDRDEGDAWFRLEVTFRDEADATLFLLRWS